MLINYWPPKDIKSYEKKKKEEETKETVPPFSYIYISFLKLHLTGKGFLLIKIVKKYALFTLFRIM